MEVIINPETTFLIFICLTKDYAGEHHADQKQM